MLFPPVSAVSIIVILLWASTVSIPAITVILICDRVLFAVIFFFFHCCCWVPPIFLSSLHIRSWALPALPYHNSCILLGSFSVYIIILSASQHVDLEPCRTWYFSKDETWNYKDPDNENAWQSRTDQDVCWQIDISLRLSMNQSLNQVCKCSCRRRYSIS